MSTTPEAPPSTVRSWQSTALATGLVIALAVIGVALYLEVGQARILPTTDLGYFRIALIIGLGIVAVVVTGRIVRAFTRRFYSERHSGLIIDVYRVVAYTILALVVLYALGINGYALLAGGTFAGLVIGLASQTALANLVAGVVLLVARPFEPGDRLTLTTWQYSQLMPTYPPKFFSDDLLTPGFTGTVQDIGLMYTEMRLDSGPRIVFPNNIVIQGAVIAHDAGQRWVRIKYEVPTTVDPVRLLPRVEENVAADDWVVGKRTVRVLVNAGTLSSYVISVDALCAGNHEEPPRSALYIRIRAVVAALSTAEVKPALPPPGAAPPANEPVGPAVGGGGVGSIPPL
jgi:small conductance mechanosensitive channel